MRRDISPGGGTPGQVPFLEQALAEGKVELGFSYEVHEVSETRNRNGYLLKTKLFIIFVYKSAPIIEALLEVLVELCQTNPSYSLNVELNDNTVEGFSLWVDDEEVRLWTKSKKSNVLDAFLSKKAPDTQKKRKAV
jgi:hypothetical protein